MKPQKFTAEETEKTPLLFNKNRAQSTNQESEIEKKLRDLLVYP